MERRQWDGSKAGTIALKDWLGNLVSRVQFAGAAPILALHTYAGEAFAQPGDWIVRAANGTFSVEAA